MFDKKLVISLVRPGRGITEDLPEKSSSSPTYTVPHSTGRYTMSEASSEASDMMEQPDYAGLVNLLPTLRRLVDAGGSVALEPHEAERIRALGFQAQPGTWRVPPLPARLVAGNPLLEPLGDDVDLFWKPSPGESIEAFEVTITDNPANEAFDSLEPMPDENAKRSTAVGVSPRAKPTPDLADDEALEKECAAILEAVERAGGIVPRRSLQKKLWRIKADPFNRSIELLRVRGLIQVEGKMLMAKETRPESSPFHAVPQRDGDIPRVESALGSDQGAGPVNGIRGASRTAPPRKVVENAN